MKASALFLVLLLSSAALAQGRPIPGIRQAEQADAQPDWKRRPSQGFGSEAHKNREARQTTAEPTGSLGARKEPSTKGVMAQNSRNFRK
jgi:hypothetical protein